MAVFRSNAQSIPIQQAGAASPLVSPNHTQAWLEEYACIGALVGQTYPLPRRRDLDHLGGEFAHACFFKFSWRQGLLSGAYA